MEHELMHLLMHYGYVGLALALAGGVVGLPIPDEVLLTFVGYQVSKGNMTYPLALTSGFIGAFLGITLSYILGLKLGLPVLKRWGPRLGITEKSIARVHVLFEKYGPFVLIIGYYLPGIRHLSAYFAGISEMSLRKFCLYAYTGGVIWISFFVTLGFKLGDNWKYVEAGFHRYGMYLLFFFIFVALLIVIYLQSIRNPKQRD